MPATKIRLYRDDDGSTPILEWLKTIETRDRKAYEKCRSCLQRLAEFGRELRRPTADYLRDGIYELRIKHSRVNYRILYGFVGKDVVLVTHGFTKEKKVPEKEIDLAAEWMKKFCSNPDQYCSTGLQKGSKMRGGDENQSNEAEKPQSKSKSFTFPQLAQAAIRQLATMSSFEEEKKFYRQAIVSLLEPFAELMGDDAIGYYRKLDPLQASSVSEQNEPYSLYILLQAIKQSDNAEEILGGAGEFPESYYTYFFGEEWHNRV